jgi:hypothetical protein
MNTAPRESTKIVACVAVTVFLPAATSIGRFAVGVVKTSTSALGRLRAFECRQTHRQMTRPLATPNYSKISL